MIPFRYSNKNIFRRQKVFGLEDRPKKNPFKIQKDSEAQKDLVRKIKRFFFRKT